jgi:glutamyl/glutaminyl-tRNA synthetase
MTFRTRQAPSPTGYLHLGAVRQLLFTKLLAKINNGVWFLRLEDTDRNRLQKEAFASFMKGCQTFGLLPDEGVTTEKSDQNNESGDDFYNLYQKGEYGPYIQSHRLSIYHEHLQKMIDKKLVYWSYITPEKRQEIQELKKVSKKAINWYNESLKVENITDEEIYASIEQGLNDPRKPALRYKFQRDKIITVHDELLGESKFDLNLAEDPIFLKGDGYPSYHLTHLIDDYLMKTTLVLRAQEWYPSIALHITSFNDYWGENSHPKYLHVPFILGETGNNKMSKRDGNVNVDKYFEEGYLPEALLNYLAFLGWNPGTEKEMYL